MSKTIQEEALQYDLKSLKELQEKRKQNIQLFEQAIKNERSAIMMEMSAQSNLEEKLNLYNAKLFKLSTEDYNAIINDIPKLKSTQERRRENINKLQQAILEEQTTADREVQMIMYLENHSEV